MSYQLYRIFTLGVDKSGLDTVSVQPYDVNNNAVGSASLLTELDAGQGNYGGLVTIPSGHIGSLRYTSGEASPVIYRESINPRLNEGIHEIGKHNLEFATLLQKLADRFLGNVGDSNDHKSTTVYEAGDTANATVSITSVQDETTRTITLL